MPRNTTLSLTLPAAAASSRDDLQSPRTPRSSRSPQSPPSPHTPDGSQTSIAEPYLAESPNITSLPSFPRSPKSPKPDREGSRSFFGNHKAAKSSSRLPSTALHTIRQVPEGTRSTTPTPSSTQTSRQRHTPISTPELAPLGFGGGESLTSDPPILGPPSIKKIEIVGHSKNEQSDPKPRPHRFPHLLSRTRSIRVDEGNRPTSRHTRPKRLAEPDNNAAKLDILSLKTAPLEKDRAFREMASSANRNRSADRQVSVDSDEELPAALRDRKDAVPNSSSVKDSGGIGFLSNIKSSSSRAADGIGKASRGIFGKLTRSGSTNEREHLSEESYVCTVITLPLVEQTRRTRISKRLADCRDKTEFWMPALPWRCIDYLNMKGCEEEGIYRIPGSGPKIKHWQMRFDTELDINLFDEPDLYDINIVASMFKTWLRELPDEILPEATQQKISESCAGAKSAPQMLKDELSKLPPFNYYLLFAITCHISLLHTNSAKNKMNYHNLCICFQPCMRIDGFCFGFLVCDWKNCWQGCWTEKEYLTEEYRTLGGLTDSAAASGSAGRSIGTVSTDNERAVSSRSSSKPSITGRSTPDRARGAENEMPLPLPQPLPQKQTSGITEHLGDELVTPTQNVKASRLSTHLPVLSPVKPLPPLGL